MKKEAQKLLISSFQQEQAGGATFQVMAAAPPRTWHDWEVENPVIVYVRLGKLHLQLLFFCFWSLSFVLQPPSPAKANITLLSCLFLKSRAKEFYHNANHYNNTTKLTILWRVKMIYELFRVKLESPKTKITCFPPPTEVRFHNQSPLRFSIRWYAA